MSIKEWKPTKRQEDFLSLPDSIFEALYGGAAGGGKTETLLMLPIAKKDKNNQPLYNHPRFKVLYLRRTFPELDSEVIPRSKEFYPSCGFLPYNDQKKRWTHPSGAIIQFGHCEHEADVQKYDTAEYCFILFDELTSFTPYQYQYLAFSRCRTSSPDLYAIVRSGTNPGNIGHSYCRRRFVEPCKTGNVILKETRLIQGKPETILRIFIPSKVEDNPHILTNDPGYITRLNKLPEKERAAKADGDWWAFTGQVFDDFREIHIPTEPANAVHVVKPFIIPSYWPRVMSIDWGFSAMTIAGWYAINPVPSSKYPAKIYKYREYTCKKTKISSWATDITRLSNGETFKDIVLDPSAWGRRGDEFNIAEQFMHFSGLTARKAENDRIAGKLNMQEMLRWSPRPIAKITPGEYNHELALEIYRKKGPKGLAEYDSIYKPEEKELFLPRFQIFDTCEETIKTIPLCIYKKDKAKQVTDKDDEGNSEDIEEFRGDDPYDETRYGLMACTNYLEANQTDHEIHETVSHICSRVEQGASPSQLVKFYIDMENVETKIQKSSRPLRRFHKSKLKFANW